MALELSVQLEEDMRGCGLMEFVGRVWVRPVLWGRGRDDCGSCVCYFLRESCFYLFE